MLKQTSSINMGFYVYFCQKNVCTPIGFHYMYFAIKFICETRILQNMHLSLYSLYKKSYNER